MRCHLSAIQMFSRQLHWYQVFESIVCVCMCVYIHMYMGFPGGKESACQCWRHKRHGFDPWVGKILYIYVYVCVCVCVCVCGYSASYFTPNANCSMYKRGKGEEEAVYHTVRFNTQAHILKHF